MMNQIKDIALGFCAAAVCLGALSFLAPPGNMKKSVKYVFSLVFLAFCIGLFSAFGRISKIKPEIPEISIPVYSADVYAESLCAAVLDDSGISYKKITADTNITEQGDIYINKLLINSAEEREKVVATVKNSMEVNTVEVVNE